MTDAPSQPAQLNGGLSKRILRLFSAQVEDWYEECRRLSRWEDQHLLDQPAPERSAEHTRLLDELERVGHWLSSVTREPGFPDHASAELVAMTLQDLRDARALWHGNMRPEGRREILRTIFNEP